MARKYSTNFERDWLFYSTNFTKLSFWGGDAIHLPTYNAAGLSGKDYFYKLDSQGLKAVSKIGCSEPDLVADILRFKKAINFHIKMWAEGYNDCLQGVNKYLETFDNPPEWVEDALRGQIYRRVK